MRARKRLAPLAVCVTVLSIAGCGTSGPLPTPNVNLSITAPTSGATVGVHEVVVAGHVSPATANVLVDGKPAQVIHGSFKRSLLVAQPSQTITVTARATGYVATSATTTIQYSPTLAAQLAAAQAAQARAQSVAAIAASPTSTPNNLSPGALSARSKALNSTFALPPQPTAPSATTSPARPPAPPRNPSRAPGPTSQPTRTPTPRPPKPPNRPSGPPTAARTLRVAEVKLVCRTLGVKGCVKTGKLTPYGACLYNRLRKTGAFSSRARLIALTKKLKPYTQTHDPSKLPAFVRLAISACISKLPALDPLTGKPVITRLPGLTQGQHPLPRHYPKPVPSS